MKKFKLLIFTFLTTLIILTPNIAMADTDSPQIFVEVNGTQLDFYDINPIRENGSIYVPFKTFFYSLGATADFENGSNYIVATKDDTTITIPVYETTATITKNNITTTIQLNPVIKDNYVYIPIRAIAEIFEYEIGWDNDLNTVVLMDKQGLEVPENISFNLVENYLNSDITNLYSGNITVLITSENHIATSKIIPIENLAISQNLNIFNILTDNSIDFSALKSEDNLNNYVNTINSSLDINNSYLIKSAFQIYDIFINFYADHNFVKTESSYVSTYENNNNNIKTINTLSIQGDISTISSTSYCDEIAISKINLKQSPSTSNLSIWATIEDKKELFIDGTFTSNN